MKIRIAAEVALNRMIATATDVAGEAPPGPDDDSRTVVTWLSDLRLLQGIPFAYLVPDEKLLRPETIRFFFLDRDWTDAAVDGALAAGTVGTRERAAIQGEHVRIRHFVDVDELTKRGGPSFTTPGRALAGFLLRSRAVSGWPGMEVKALRASSNFLTPVRVLRMERLAPAVLLVIFDGVPTQVDIEEPRQGLQFGAEEQPGSGGTRWRVRARNPGGQEVPGASPAPVPFRAGSAGVIHTQALLNALAGRIPGARIPFNSAQFAAQLVRYPQRQRFRTGTPGVVGSAEDAEGPTS